MENLARENLETEKVVLVPVDQCHRSPSQPRRRGSDEVDEDFVASIKSQGVLQPIVVRDRTAGGWEIVFGHRRHKGSVAAKLEKIPAIVRALTDEQVFEAQLIENVHRNDMHPLDEADGFKRMIDKSHRTPRQIADRIGRKVVYVVQRLKLCELVKEGRKALDEDKISLGVAVLLARVPAQLQAEALKSLYHGASVETARRQLQERYMLRLAQAPFDITSAELVPAAGACTACPKRTGQQRELFPEAGKADLCVDPICFRTKQDAVWKIRVKEAKAGGTPVLEGKPAATALSYGGGYKKLDDTEWIGGKEKTVRALLGKDLPPVVLARDDQRGTIHQLVKAADFAKVLKKLQPRARLIDTGGDYHKRQDAKDRLRVAAVGLAVAAAVENVNKLGAAKLTRLLTYGLVDRAWDDARSAVLRRRNLEPKDPKKGPYMGSEARLLQYLKTLSKDEDVAGLGLELILRTVGPSRNGMARPLWGDTLKALGVNFAAIQKKVAADAKAKKKAKAPGKKRAAS